jgi:cyclopropane fatty-acyl-phospholipid synthase-like methyltransferase
MMNTVARWRSYWQDKSFAGFRYESPEHYQQCAAELRVLFQQETPQTVLEIGCGNGALYEYLGFHRCQRYLGVDFSPSMLNVFHEHYPQVSLVCQDGSMFRDGDKYDLIFSNGVLQHFDAEMLQRHFSNVRQMMQPTSLFICASIPWKALWFRFLSGELNAEGRSHPFRAVVFRIMRAFSADGMGYWYEHRKFRYLAEQAGMSATFYGSIHYAYRFHAVMRLK